MKNPEKYFESNISGFFNICNLSKINKVKNIIYASSSSVYGDNKNLPVKEKFRTNPLNYYAISKVNNEQTAKFFSEISNIKFVGLRFFFQFMAHLEDLICLFIKVLNCINKNKNFI